MTFPAFVPSAAQRLQDADAIALLQRLRRRPIVVPNLMPGDVATTVSTAIVTPKRAAVTAPPPLLLLPGFDSSLLEFRHLMPYLEPHCSVYAVDPLGFGFTAPQPLLEVNPSTIRQHLYATWQALIDRPMTLLGASLGGAIAIDFALHYPPCIERLVLIDSVGFSGSFPLGQWLSAPLLDWGTHWLHWRKDTAVRFLETWPFSSPQERDLVLCSSLHQALSGWQQAVQSFTRSGGYSDLPKHIAQIKSPTLILWGDRDTTLGTQDACKFAQTIPHSRLVWIKGGDHAPHLGHPEAIAAALLNDG